ncbi:tubulin beta [Acrasis kona]|uniref:Tubulin beta n=1 Tax=Acrasis kona TaxID=1008807 RepID=A0AAW2YTY0_9EUKA
MGEIIHIQNGACGNRIGEEYLARISLEHGIYNYEYSGCSDCDLVRVGTYFNETQNKYTARAVMVNLDPSPLDSVKQNPGRCSVSNNNIITGNVGALGRWKEGRILSSEIIDTVMDVIRCEAEKANNLQGFQMLHSLGGGCGSSMSSLIMENIRDNYVKKDILNFPVFPSRRLATSQESYNTIMGLDSLINYSDCAICIDNDTIENKIGKVNGIDDLKLVNETITLAMSGVTLPLRSYDHEHFSLGDLMKVTKDKLKFLMCGVSPIPECRYDRIWHDVVSNDNMIVPTNGYQRRLISGLVTYRGRCSDVDVYDQVTQQLSNYYVECNGVDISICQTIPIRHHKISACSILNSVNIIYLLENVLKTSETNFIGPKYQDIVYAKESVLNLINEYKLQG